MELKNTDRLSLFDPPVPTENLSPYEKEIFPLTKFGESAIAL